MSYFITVSPTGPTPSTLYSAEEVLQYLKSNKENNWIYVKKHYDRNATSHNESPIIKLATERPVAHLPLSRPTYAQSGIFTSGSMSISGLSPFATKFARLQSVMYWGLVCFLAYRIDVTNTVLNHTVYYNIDWPWRLEMIWMFIDEVQIKLFEYYITTIL